MKDIPCSYHKIFSNHKTQLTLTCCSVCGWWVDGDGETPVKEVKTDMGFIDPREFNKRVIKTADGTEIKLNEIKVGNLKRSRRVTNFDRSRGSNLKNK